MLTILTWLWDQGDGRPAYTAEHVNVWADMVRRHVSIPHRLACVTDMPDGIDPRVVIIPSPRDFEDVRIPAWGPGKPQCLRRLSLYRRDAGQIFGERFVSMDMDVLITDSLDAQFSRSDDIVLLEGTRWQIGNDRPYSGGMLMMTAGARPQVFETFTPVEACKASERYIGSDQAWISYCLGPGEATFGERDGITRWERANVFGATARMYFFAGFPKPSDLVASNDLVRLHYRRDRGGRCLILGHDLSVWREAHAAIKNARFDAVIASPEAAEHWPGDILAISDCDAHADWLARVHGFDQVVFCGRSEKVAA